MSLFGAPAPPVEATADEHRHFIEKIAVGHGYIAAETLAAMPPDVRRLVEEALKKDTKSSTEASQLLQKLAAGNINVAYELLQNADDNEYSKARASFEAPRVTFVIAHDAVYIESNEDGFSQSDIKALCDFNKSSKSGRQGYLGQPGVGFRSVFTIASKVHIESGPYSFDFQHEDGDNGFGMVRPLWAAPAELPDYAKVYNSIAYAKSRTKIVLYFKNENVQHCRESFVRDLWETPETVLLFMRNLRGINITVLDKMNKPERSKEVMLEKDIWGTGTRIQTTKRIGVTQVKLWHRYHVYRSKVDGLPSNTNRRPGPTGFGVVPDSSAEVAIAFPVDVDNEPFIEKQQLYAFMPIKETAFKFLVHSDFVKDESRQDIYAPSQRNIALRNGVFQVLWTAIQDLIKKPVLEHRWIRYLPRDEDLASDRFWQDMNIFLRPKIISTPLLRPGSRALGKFCKIDSLSRLLESQQDKEGKPLLPDLPVESYVSAAYQTEDLDVLSGYGLGYMQMGLMIPRLEAFTKSDDWKTKAFDLRDEDWHSRLTRLIVILWNDKQHDWKSTIKAMKLIPLKSREFKPASGSDFYFPEIDGVPVPQDLDIAMILPAAAANPDCRVLYEILGAKTVDGDLVRTMIMSTYRDPGEVAKLDALKSKSHLHYLYRMEPKVMIDKDDQNLMIVFDHKDRVRHPRREYVYLHGEGDWSPAAMLMPPYEPGVPEPDASLLHPVYYEDQPSPSPGNARSWTEWLYNAVYCEEKIQLFTTREPSAEADKEYSPEYIYIIWTRPEQALLRLMQNFQKPQVKKLWLEDEIGSKLMRTMQFLCTDGVRRPLEESFLPLKSLVAICESNSAKADSMPFLKLKSEMEDADIPAWMDFAGHFGISSAHDLRFTLAMIGSVAKSVTKTSIQATRNILDLYLKLHTQYNGATALEQIDLQRQIRNYFNNQPCILTTAPSYFGSPENAVWVKQTKCLWNAPPNMVSYISLNSIWTVVLDKLNIKNREEVANFFHKTLAIRNITAQDILSELSVLSRTSPPMHDMKGHVTELYSLLPGSMSMEHSRELIGTMIKQRFRDNALIYVPDHGEKRWFKVSECVWASDDATKEEVCLEKIYPGLSTFFLDLVGLSNMSVGLTGKRLVEVGQTIKPIPYLKELLWAANEFFVTNKESPALLDGLLTSRTFPVRMLDGTVQPTTLLGSFCINDRPQYAEVLRGKVQLLDFTPEEVNRLRPLLEKTKLIPYLLSNRVVERTSVEQSQSVEDKEFSEDMINKAAAFISIADYFGNRASASRLNLQSTLRRVEVYRHVDIKLSLTCNYRSITVTAPAGRGDLHFHYALSGTCRIYLPQDDEDRDVCVTSKLPRRLAAHILGCSVADVDPNAVIVTASILQAKLNSVGRILASHGITLLDISPKDSQGPPQTPRQQQGSVFKFSQGGPSQVTARVLFGSPPPVLSPPRSTEAATSPYQALLIQVVNVARVAMFPDRASSFDMSALSESLSPTTSRTGTFRFYVGDQTDWQRMVGAAGELYVFELLSRHTQALPGFSRDNWQSTVRHFINEHPDYANLEDWHGAEKGDLFFDDVAGTFTSYLIETGYLEEKWRSERPEYYIEVKTTTSSRFETPFYMSKHQYARMQSYVRSVTTANERKKVYILFRVYGLESGQVGVRIYVDLEASRAKGELEFEAQNWTITPRPRPV